MKLWPRHLGNWLLRYRSLKSKFGASRRKPHASYQQLCLDSLESRQVMTVSFHGGAVLSQVETQAVYLGSDWNTNATIKGQVTQLDNYLSYIVRSPYMDMLTNAGYGVGRGSSTAGAVDAVSLSKTANLSDASIQSYLNSMINSGQLATPDANRLYVVYVEPGVVVSLAGSTSKNSFLGYHGAFAGSAGEDVHYAVMPYPGTPNPTPGSQGFATVFDELTVVTSHELAEAVTDPNVNYKSLGWYDDTLNGEIGDLTSQTATLNGYLVQDVVDKNDKIITPTTVTTSVTAPQNVTAGAQSSTSANISWSAVTNATGYRVYQVNNSQNVLLSTVGAGSTSTTVAGLAAGSKVTLFVEAFNATSTADSAQVSITLPSAPPLTAPQGVQATASSTTSAVITWTASSGATSYNVYMVSGSTHVLLGTVLGVNATRFNATGLTPGSTVSFMVEAVGAAGAVADSNVVSLTLPSQSSTLSSPNLTIMALNSSNVLLNWNTISGAQGYRIFVMIGNQAVLLGIVSARYTNVIVTGLPPGQPTKFMVEAFNSTSIGDSAWVTVTTPSRSRRDFFG